MTTNIELGQDTIIISASFNDPLTGAAINPATKTVKVYGPDTLDTIKEGPTALVQASVPVLGQFGLIITGVSTWVAGHYQVVVEANPGGVSQVASETFYISTNFKNIEDDTNELQTDWVNGGRLDIILDGAAVPGDSMALTAAAIDAIFDELVTTHGVANSLGEFIQLIKSDTTSILADTNELQGDWTDGGRLDLIIDDILADTNELQNDDVPGLIAALNDPSASAIADAVWDEDLEVGHAVADSAAIKVKAIEADTNELQTDWVDGGRLDLIVDAILADTGTTIPAQITALNDPTTAAIADAVWDEDLVVGHSVADSAAVKVKAIETDTNELQGDWTDGGRLDLILDDVLEDTSTTLPGQITTHDSNIDGDVAAVKADTAAILIDTNELQTDWTDSGRLDLILDAVLADTNELQTDWVDGGRLDLLVDAILADTNELQSDWTDNGRLDLILDDIQAKVASTLLLVDLGQQVYVTQDFLDAGGFVNNNGNPLIDVRVTAKDTASNNILWETHTDANGEWWMILPKPVSPAPTRTVLLEFFKRNFSGSLDSKTIIINA